MAVAGAIGKLERQPTLVDAIFHPLPSIIL
jgi:hypothetical protein